MDWDRIEKLLNIVDKARHWPNLKAIHDGAMNELVAIASNERQSSSATVVKVLKEQIARLTSPTEPSSGSKLERRI